MANGFQKILQGFDLFPAPATLRTASEPQTKTSVVGVISLLVSCLFVFIFIQGTIEMFKFENISYTESKSSSNRSQIYGNFSMLGVTLNWEEAATFSKLFVWKMYINKKDQPSKQIILRECVQDDWVMFGDNYKQIYKQYYISYMFCPAPGQQFSMKDTFKSQTPNYIDLTLQSCTSLQTPDPTCNYSSTQAKDYFKNQSQIFSFSQIQIFLLDTALQLNDKNIIKYFINSDIKAQLTEQFGGGAVIEFSRFYVQTDVSVLPWVAHEIVQGTFVDIVKNFHMSLGSSGVYAIFRFVMNQKKYTYKRKVGKIDELFSYVGGLFSTVLTLLSILIANYNQYRYEIRTSENLFLTYSQKQASQNSLSFWLYLKYSIFDWLKVFFCCQINWKDCIEIDQCREEVIKQMDTGRILRRLNYMESAIKCCLSEEQLICVCLSNRSYKDENVKNDAVMEYYHQITKGRCPYSISDIKQINDFIKIQVDQNRSPSSLTSSPNSSIIDLSSLASGKPSKLGELPNMNYKISRQGDPKKILQLILQQYSEIKMQAEQIQLDSEQKKVEQKITWAINSLGMDKYQHYVYKIPVIILYRIFKCQQDNIGSSWVEGKLALA